MEQTIEFYDCLAREWRIVVRRWDGHYWRFSEGEVRGPLPWSVRKRFEAVFRDGERL
jgi:hypothetical protein